MAVCCEECRTRDEGIYWNCFQSTHFFQYLRSGFDQQLEIPEIWARNLKRELESTVFIKGPSGSTWSVGIAEKDGTLFFNQNWPQFVKDHHLVEGDHLLFKYNRDSHFNVLIFNGGSQCEKVTSYFFRKCGHANQDTAQRKTRESPAEFISNSSHSNNEGSPPEKETNTRGNKKSVGEPSVTVASRKRTRTRVSSGLCQRQSERQKALFLSPKERNASHDGGETAVARNVTTSSNYTSNRRNVTNTSNRRNVTNTSNRRNVTREEIEGAERLAEAALTSEGFLAVMKPSHLHNRFFLSIPSWWLTKYLTLENQDVILLCNEKTWRVKFNVTKPNCGGLASGWKNFALDNKLEVYDVCVFKPETEAKPIVLSVRIIRVVEGVASPTSVVYF